MRDVRLSLGGVEMTSRRLLPLLLASLSVAQAVAVREGEITYVGTTAGAMDLSGDTTQGNDGHRRAVNSTALDRAVAAECSVSRGVLEDDEAFIKTYTQDLDFISFKVHTHVIDDRAARVAIEAFEEALEQNRPSGLPHTPAHGQWAAMRTTQVPLTLFDGEVVHALPPFAEP